MKSLIYAVVAASVLAPVASFAQSNSSVTREQVRVELVQLQQAGYEASSRGAHYPDDIRPPSSACMHGTRPPRPTPPAMARLRWVRRNRVNESPLLIRRNRFIAAIEGCRQDSDPYVDSEPDTFGSETMRGNVMSRRKRLYPDALKRPYDVRLRYSSTGHSAGDQATHSDRFDRSSPKGLLLTLECGPGASMHISRASRRPACPDSSDGNPDDRLCCR